MMKKKFNIDDIELKKNPFKAPQGYFMQVENEVWIKIRSQESASAQVSANGVENETNASFFQIVKPMLSMVVTFIFIMCIGFSVMKLTKTEIEPGSENEFIVMNPFFNDSLSQDESFIAIIESFPQLDTDYEVLTKAIRTFSTNSDEFDENTITDEEIEMFLIEENTSIFSLASLYE